MTQWDIASVDRLDEPGPFSVTGIRIDNGGINRLTTEQAECIVSSRRRARPPYLLPRRS